MLVYQRVLYASRLDFATGTSNNVVSELVAEEFQQEAPIFHCSWLQNPIVFVEDLPSQPIGKNHGAIEFCFNFQPSYFKWTPPSNCDRAMSQKPDTLPLE